MKEQIRRLYNECGQINDIELIYQIQDLNIKNEDKRIIRRIIARQCAFDYLKFGSIIFSNFNRILSEYEMLEENIIFDILKECILIIIQIKTGKIPSIKIKNTHLQFEKHIPEKREELYTDLINYVEKRIVFNYWETGAFEECKKISNNNLLKMEEGIINKIKSNYINKALKNKNIDSRPPSRIIEYGFTNLIRLEIKAKIRGKYDSFYSDYQSYLSICSQDQPLDWEEYLEKEFSRDNYEKPF